MSQQSSTPKNSRRKSNTWIAVLGVGLVVGLALGIVVSVLFILLNITQETGIVNPVQVSSMVSETQVSSIQFVNYNETMNTRCDHHVLIVGEHSSIVLSGEQPYDVHIDTGQTSDSYEFSVYIPSNVTTFTANF
jgi:MFS superfamily sulfate permease-like transporter